MNFIEKSQLINVIVQEIVEAIIPVNWNYIYFYTERLRDKEIGLRKKQLLNVGSEKNQFYILRIML
ncbi:hypothetical protein [Acinetobacter baumannii]|uniref:hypothetical protein n=1 Tax=Acinetobacter baumannii TaxID=470 RepID=UPI000DE64B19|nr:hypothetical protein [Acinetobacter baumannii]MDC4301664.1 hypothetical protein [Acinetobacter baumannii]MDC4642252.1 hypothetical protein [Acinetobacter baumannii]MDC4840301.1 hypothetical protein [Acinetobacter baumannii]MDC4851032.1 hypothetical protein [Acinetobacter baumannii]MDC4861950.1 hypothetical protein [Acinetobacter baumannii]